MVSYDETDTTLVDQILEKYRSLNHKSTDGTYVILAAFALTSFDPDLPPKIIALATGCKCLPRDRLPEQGDALHDSHAEVLARRCARRWLLEEIGRYAANGGQSRWLTRGPDDIFSLKDDVRMIMYVSTPPCKTRSLVFQDVVDDHLILNHVHVKGGDASMRFLASYQDTEMAQLKNAAVFEPLEQGAAARGRDNYALLGVLRTKPGRADSPPTLCMSCTDKIARWNVLGIQGALGSAFLHPIYVSRIIIGEVPEHLQGDVRSDCERAFWGRLAGVVSALEPPFRVHRPEIVFTPIPFEFSKLSISPSGSARSFNESLSFIADSAVLHEILINGLRRGVPPKHRFKKMFRPHISKVSMLQLYEDTLCLLHSDVHQNSRTYFEVKHGITHYQEAKARLLGQGCAFAGWVRSGLQWENFTTTSCVTSSPNGEQQRRS